jgi:Restriction endonuclease
MGQLPGEPPDFAPLFAAPSIEGMLQLTDHEFEHFVGYVFEQAGYVVEDAAGKYGQGLDLRLYTRTAHAPVLHAGVSVKKFRPPNVPPPHSQVGVGHVVALKGALAGQDGVAGYVVTSSIFTLPGHNKALEHPLVWPVDGLRQIIAADGHHMRRFMIAPSLSRSARSRIALRRPTYALGSSLSAVAPGETV